MEKNRNTSKQSGAWDTKLKNNGRAFIGLLLVLAVLLGLMWVADNVFNQFIASWFEINFIDTYDYGSVVREFIDWPAMRRLLIFCTVFITVVIYIGNHLYLRYRIKKEQNTLQETIIQYLDHIDTLHLPKEYANLEMKLLQMEMDARQSKELAIKESERKNDLITYLAHDLNTPLASVIGYLSFLSEVQELPPEQRMKYTDIALKKAYYLESLINQFFDITKFNLHNIVLQKERINIRLILEQLVEEFYPLTQEKQVHIQLSVNQVQDIYVDSDKFGRVLNNVLKNAVAYCYENSVITIQERIADENLIIQITNEGDPIPETKLAMIFDKFYRLDEARSTKKGGTGLGLAIAKEIIEAHHGMITANSNEQHTCFTIQVPVK